MLDPILVQEWANALAVGKWLNAPTIRQWANALAPYAALFTAVWAIHTYRRAKKVEVARLQKQIFDDLYLSGKLAKIREALDFDYASTVEPLVRTLLDEEEAQFTKPQRALLLQLDNFLNLIEYALYLESDKGLLRRADRRALLAYWLDFVARRPSLEDYARTFDYERLARCAAVERKRLERPTGTFFSRALRLASKGWADVRGAGAGASPGLSRRSGVRRRALRSR